MWPQVHDITTQSNKIVIHIFYWPFHGSNSIHYFKKYRCFENVIKMNWHFPIIPYINHFNLPYMFQAYLLSHGRRSPPGKSVAFSGWLICTALYYIANWNVPSYCYVLRYTVMKIIWPNLGFVSFSTLSSRVNVPSFRMVFEECVKYCLGGVLCEFKVR